MEAIEVEAEIQRGIEECRRLGREPATIVVGDAEYREVLCLTATYVGGDVTIFGPCMVERLPGFCGVRVLPSDWQGYGQGAVRGGR